MLLLLQNMRKSLGNKRKEITDKQSNDLFEIYSSFKEGEFCKIFERNFLLHKVVIENPIIENGQVKRIRKVPREIHKKRILKEYLLEKASDYFIEEVLKGNASCLMID